MQHYGRVWAVAAVVLVNAAFSAAAAYSEAAIDDVWNVPGARGTIGESARVYFHMFISIGDWPICSDAKYIYRSFTY